MLSDDSSHQEHFAPPSEPVEVFCLHCGNVYCSSEMKFVPCPDGACHLNGQAGDWMCAAPGCDGIGFQFDIHPTDTWCDCDEEEEDEFHTSDIDDDYAEEAFSDFLSDSEEEVFLPADTGNTDDFLDELASDQDWLESREYPYARRWRMWVHFRQWTHDSSSDLSPPSRGEHDKFNDEDIPF